MRHRFNQLVRRRKDDNEDGDTLPRPESRTGEKSPVTHQFAIDLAGRNAQSPVVEPTVEEEED